MYVCQDFWERWQIWDKTFSLASPAGRPLRCLKSHGGFRQGGLGKTAQVSGYQVVPREGPRVYPLGGEEGHREWHFPQQNCLFSLQHSLWQSYPAGLVAGSQTARQKGGGCISCVMTDCLWLKDYPNRWLLAIYRSAFPVSKLNN